MKRRTPPAVALHVESYVPYLVNRAATAMLNYAAREFDKFDLTPPQWRILLTLWHHQVCRFGELATLTSIAPPTLSRLLNALRESGIVKQKRTEADSRSVEVSLTAAGRALFEKTLPFAESTNSLYIKGLSASDLNTLRRALTTIYENVRRQEEAEHEAARTETKRA
jgi:MarR family transcriptional regulator, organic hydroperoxide resistance regulator